MGIACVASTALADQNSITPESRYKKFLAATPISTEESDKVLFKAKIDNNYTPPRVNYQIQNGLSDAVIVGIVLSIRYKDTTTGAEREIELYSDCGDQIPMTYLGGSLPLFDGAEIAKFSPSISVKEIRVRKIWKGN